MNKVYDDLKEVLRNIQYCTVIFQYRLFFFLGLVVVKKHSDTRGMDVVVLTISRGPKESAQEYKRHKKTASDQEI